MIVKRIVFATFVLIIAIGAIIGFSILQKNAAINSTSSERLTIAATIFPIADIARNVAGPEVKVLQVLPTGNSEHEYTLSPQRLLDIQQAKLLFAIGQGLDTWATGPIGSSNAIPIVTVDTGIAMRAFGDKPEQDKEEVSNDPHYWLTVPNAKQIATTMATALSSADPVHADNYAKNLAAYERQLEALEVNLQQHAGGTASKDFIAMHDAWRYFADHYDFKLVATYEPVEGREPSIADLNSLQEIIARYDLKIFYSEPQKQSISAIRFLRDEFGLEIRVLDPIGGILPHDSYLNLMQANMNALTSRIPDTTL